MTPRPSWQARSRRTLRFVDREVEHEYQASAAVGTAQLRAGPLIAVGLWLVGGLLTPWVTHVVATPVYAIAAAMAMANLVGVAVAPRATTLDRQQLVGTTLNVLAGLAVLVLAVLADRFDQYAAPALMLISVFAFIVLRLQFTFAALVTAIYIASFWGFGLAVSSPGLGLNLFLVAATVCVACAGTYVLEDAQRRVFAQGRLIAALHEQVNRLFHQYLSPDVATALLEEHGRADLGGEVVDITVLFADLQGFTPYSERTSPAEIVELLNTYYGAAVPVIFGEGGTIVQFAGDAVMAIFNAPLRQPDHALRAARAGLGLQAAVNAVASRYPERPRFRVGINSGLALVGNIGSDQIRNFTAIGDVTNLAARLQTFAEPGQVVLSERTLAQLEGRAVVRPLGAPSLKGKSEAVRVYELLGLQ